MSKLNEVPVFILAGGLGTRLSEETTLKPKPMVEIGGLPILIHIMRWYYSFGFNDFVICAGYKSWDIKDYFLNYSFRRNHLSIDHRQNTFAPALAEDAGDANEKWRVRVLETGHEAMTGDRLARAFDIVSAEQNIENFAVTYGDGLCDVDLKREFDFHLNHGRVGTLLGVHQASRFGEMDVAADGRVTQFSEKPEAAKGVINGGFFLFRRDFRRYLQTSGACTMERAPLQNLTRDDQLSVFEHQGFWACMDTLRDKTQLESVWEKGRAPWLPAKQSALSVAG